MKSNDRTSYLNEKWRVFHNLEPKHCTILRPTWTSLLFANLNFWRAQILIGDTCILLILMTSILLESFASQCIQRFNFILANKTSSTWQKVYQMPLQCFVDMQININQNIMSKGKLVRFSHMYFLSLVES